MQVNAQLAADGVGLPAMWMAPDGWVFSSREECDCLDQYDLDLSEHQTHEGLARQVAMWAGDGGAAGAYWLAFLPEDDAWTLDASPREGNPLPETVWEVPDMSLETDDPDEALAAIVEHIGLDHRIRRALGDTPEPGTLAPLTLSYPSQETDGGTYDVWDFDCPAISRRYPLPLGLTPLEALRAIAQEITP